MCGIAGILDPGGVAAAEVERMADTLAHRGPDDAAVHVEPGLGFGFRRLAIIDLESGRQPIPNEDETVWVMLNGEIYNYRALRGRLRRRGHRFTTRSDAEVLVHLYEERGDALVDELRGMFAFAIWDRRRRRLLLARDHLGQKPLYWARLGGRFLFASEIKAILEVAPQLRTMDPQALHEYLSLRIIADPRSMFDGVRKLPPAHRMVVDAESQMSERYWTLGYEPKRRQSESDARAEMGDAIRDAVRLHLVSDVPVGAFLSGGVDSGLVAASMRDLGAGSFKTFSVGVPYGDYDEAPVARRVAKQLGTRHFEDAVGGDLVTTLPDVVYHLDEPSDPLSLCMYHIAAMTAREVKVVLGGDGGDELFGGYDRYYGTRYVRYYAALPRGLREHVLGPLIDRAPDGFWYKSLSHRLRWLHELARETGGRRYARSLGYFYFTPDHRDPLYTERFRRRIGDFDPERTIIAWHEDDHAARTAVDRMLLADTMVRLPNHSVMILDRMCMAHGLEARSPFLDHRLAERAAALPANLKIRGRRRRYLQMRLAERSLPDEVVNRPKQGFSSALPYVMREQFRALFRHFLPESRLVGLGLLRGDTVRSMLNAHLNGETDHGNRLWLLLNAEVWYRIHIEEQSPAGLKDDIRGLLGERTAGARGTAVAAG